MAQRAVELASDHLEPKQHSPWQRLSALWVDDGLIGRLNHDLRSGKVSIAGGDRVVSGSVVKVVGAEIDQQLANRRRI